MAFSSCTGGWPASAARSSATDWKRRPVVTSVARKIACSTVAVTAGFTWRGGGISTLPTMRCTLSGGDWPVSSMYSVAPRA